MVTILLYLSLIQFCLLIKVQLKTQSQSPAARAHLFPVLPRKTSVLSFFEPLSGAVGDVMKPHAMIAPFKIAPPVLGGGCDCLFFPTLLATKTLTHNLWIIHVFNPIQDNTRGPR